MLRAVTETTRRADGTAEVQANPFGSLRAGFRQRWRPLSRTRTSLRMTRVEKNA